ncbi:hypothetical protein [Blastococcus saxobsidens]|uniref:Uncharacterized protein n=1 Tax=Blastococcus saxobsidens (strain DD2) TaxID=1146883 RepID=H6RT36_BLASD|nr:hypothetical protein [Blastococcus saxobsidens]CCG04339.1 Protein of unknown function [Blastococcus saxobsidens DD2]
MTGAGAAELRVELPALAGPLDTLWDLVLDLAGQLPPTGWVLVGGQMVILHGLLAGRVATRASQDVDVLADLLTDEAGLVRCVRAVRDLDLEPQPDAAGKVYRFVRARDQAGADVLAPDQDHTPPRRRLRTVGGDTIRIEGGTQALQRALAAVAGLRVVHGLAAQAPGRWRADDTTAIRVQWPPPLRRSRDPARCRAVAVPRRPHRRIRGRQLPPASQFSRRQHATWGFPGSAGRGLPTSLRWEQSTEGRVVSKHLLDETAEFTMPRIGRHAAPETGELEVTQRFDPGFQQRRAMPSPQQGRVAEVR